MRSVLSLQCHELCRNRRRPQIWRLQRCRPVGTHAWKTGVREGGEQNKHPTGLQVADSRCCSRSSPGFNLTGEVVNERIDGDGLSKRSVGGMQCKPTPYFKREWAKVNIIRRSCKPQSEGRDRCKNSPVPSRATSSVTTGLTGGEGVVGEGSGLVGIVADVDGVAGRDDMARKGPGIWPFR